MVSGNDLIIFDPHEKYLREHKAKNAIRFHFESGKENEFVKNYPDQFEPYKNIDLNTGQKISFQNEFNGTLFRFPIRNKEAAQVSELCSTYRDVDKIIFDDILESFFHDLNLILLFLRRIQSIEIFEVKNGEQVLIASTAIDFENSSENLSDIRLEIFEKLVTSLNKEKVIDHETFNKDDLAYNFKLAIKTRILDRNTNLYTNTSDEYLMSSYVKFKSCSENLKELAEKTSNFAACCVAYKLEKNISEKFKQSRYFCFLPMPETIEKSGLPLHIHGSFGLRDDRRDFKWLSNDAKEDEAAKWNELMVNEVLNMVLIQLIDYAKTLIEIKDPDFDLDNFYYLLPDLRNIALNWKEKHLKSFLNSLSENDLVLNRCSQWSNINQIYLTNKMDLKIEQFIEKNGLVSKNCFKDTIYDCFDPKKLSAISIPDHVLKIFEEYNKLDNLNYIDDCMILEEIRDMSNYESLTNEQKIDLLNYLIQSISKLEMLDNLELLPLKDGTWARFNESPVFYLENSDILNLFKGINHLIFEDKFLNEFSKYQLIKCLLKKDNDRFQTFDQDNFGFIYERSLFKEYNFEEIEQVWIYILTNFYDSLTPLEHLPLVPYKREGKIEYFNLKNKNSDAKYFVIENQNEPLNKLKCFFQQYSNEILFFEKWQLPQAFINHPKIFDYVSYFDKDGLIDCLLNLNKYCTNSSIKMKDLIKNNLNSEQKEIISDFLNLVEDLSRENFDHFLIGNLPIFKAINKDGEFFTIEDGGFSFLKAKIDIQNLPIDPNLIIIDGNSNEKLFTKLNLKNFNLNDLIETSIDYHCFNKDLKSIYVFLEWIMVNRFKKFEDINIDSFLKNSIYPKPIFTNNLNELKCLKEIYDPEDRFVKNFVSQELQLNEDYINDIFYPSLKPYLKREIEIQLFEEYFQNLDSNNTGYSEKEFFDRCLALFEYMSHLEDKQLDNLVELSSNYRWLPCSDWSQAKFYKSNELWDSAYINLIKYVKPIYDSKLIPDMFKKKLNIIADKPSLEDVIENFEFIVNNYSSIGFADVEEIYTYFQNLVENQNYQAENLLEKLKCCFGSKFFVFDGIDSFKNESNLIWKSELADLSPHFTVLNLNSFLKKFYCLYTRVFGVVEQLNLDLLIDLLEKIKKNPCNENTKNSILIFSVYNLIEQKFQQELVDSKELHSKFILPVLNQNNNVEFENIGKCVYLVETELYDQANSSEIVYDEMLSCKIDLLNQKGFKICSQKISTKFLKRLGVSSSIEKLMGVESMSIESFGQYEKLTDRIKELLDGYKDGISIFKEAIQNADDAGATVVKICYDKRQNHLWTNPNKLLDPGLAKCQGESLIFYNDAVFTDNDFENLIKLGAGTKKNFKEKVGKFGLGFNTFYNVTDLPCILSRESLVLLDPNVKFMTKIIRNRGEPGKKINFRSMSKLIRTNYCDQFKPFENLFGCDIFSDDFSFNGTLIRLPLRTEPSDISSKVYNNDSEIKSLLNILINNAETLLLFTQSVHTVEFHVIPSEATSPETKLVLKFQKKPELYLEKFDTASSDEQFSSQTKILSECTKNLERDLKSAIILRNKVEFFEKNCLLISSEPKYDIRSGDHFWLTVSSYHSKYLIKNNPIFENFIPCVGCAVKLKKEWNNYSIVASDGQAFCFLPLPIFSNLKFHVNAGFDISRDRLSFMTNTKDDKISDQKHKWNGFLVQPLVENLLLMIKLALNRLQINDFALFLKYMWPLQMKTNFFDDLEEKFYETICFPNNNHCIYPTILNQTNKFANFDQSLFVDFDFKDDKTQTRALQLLKSIYPTKSLIILPFEYLKVIKIKANDISKFVDDLSLLKTLVLLINLLPLNKNDYIQLLKFYLQEKCFKQGDLTEFANIIKSEKCIPTCNNNFKHLKDLVDPNSNLHFKYLFSKEDDMFPCEELSQNEQISNIMAFLGMRKKFLDNQTVINLAIKIQHLNDIPKAKILSDNLSKYLLAYYNENPKKIDELIDNLDSVKWMFPLSKSEKWNFPWFESVNTKYKPSELYNSKYQKLLCLVVPLFDKQYSCFIKKFENDNLLVLVIEQFKLLKKYMESNVTENLDFSKYFNEFCKYLNNSIEKKKKNEQIEDQLKILKESLPKMWIFCENNSVENKFQSIKSFAIKVENQAEPDLLPFPKNLIDKTEKLQFFKRMGLIDNFTLESLRLKLVKLKNEFADVPLDDSKLDYCFKIVNEILYVDRYKKDSESLNAMINSKDFYLPDENGVLRSIKKMCYERSLGTLLAEHQIYPVHEKIAFKNFGISSSKKKVLSLIGDTLDFEQFGQKESLIDRIKDILARYSTESSIFKELVQNADDAKATRISFILDTRNHGTNFIPFEELAHLQGPSICCYNNAIFTENDLNGIIRLSKGSKQTNKNKIGKFGIGFNSVYHLTDMPVFISNYSDFVLFDPMIRYFLDLEKTNPGIRIKNVKTNLNNDLFRDVLNGFLFDGFDLENATMFRFPLRTSHSDISTSTYDIKKALELIENFIEYNLHDIILFLKNIREISFFLMGNDNKLEKLDQVTISHEKDEQFEIEKNRYFDSDLKSIPNKMTSYWVETTSLKFKKQYFVLEQFGFNQIYDKENLLKILSGKPRDKYFPNACLAFDMDLFDAEKKSKKFNIYNFLPIENETSPLKCHINAYWALREENRTNLFDFGMRTKNADKDTAEWLTNWNLCLINLIIFPLFLELINNFRNNSNFGEKCNTEQFIEAYLSIFPDINNIQKDNKYFENFFREFYKTIMDLKTIPIFLNEINWFRPNQLYFSLNFKTFMNRSIIRFNQIESKIIFDIFWSANIYICKYNSLIKIFKQNGNVDLALLTPTILIKKLTENHAKIANKKIQDSIFLNVDNLMLILEYCLSENKPEKVILQNCPLLLRQDEILTCFNFQNKIVKRIGCNYKDCGHLFLHSKFYEMFRNYNGWFRNLVIDDLKKIFPSILDKNIFFISEHKNYPEVSYENKKLIDEAVKLINDIEWEKLKKREILEKLKPIEDWAIISVEKDNKKIFMPIKEANRIVKRSYSRFEETKSFPILNYQNLNIEFFQKIVEDLEIADDLITYFKSQQNNFKNIFSNNKNYLCPEVFCRFIKEKTNNLYQREYYFKLEDDFSHDQDSIKNLLKSLPIYKDIFDRYVSINNSEIILLNLSNLPNKLKKFFNQKLNDSNSYLSEFLDFANHRTNCYIIGNQFDILFKFLDIEPTPIEKLYYLFFKWVLSIEDFKLLQYHIDNLLCLGIDCLKKDQLLWNLLKQIKFIKIENKDNVYFYPANKVYDCKNELFKKSMGEYLLPPEYDTQEWRLLLDELGLKKTCEEDDCILIATTLKNNYLSKNIDLNQLNDACELLINKISEFQENTPFINEISEIDFIPILNNDNFLETIESPSSIHGELICLKGSVYCYHQKFAWLIKPVLPWYIKNMTKNARIVSELSRDILVKNYFKIIDILSQNNKNLKLKKIKKKNKELLKLFISYYEEFSAKEDEIIFDQLKNSNCILVNLSCDKSNQFEFCEPNKIVKNLTSMDQIDNFIYKLPEEYSKYWHFFNKIGVHENVPFDLCQKLLEHYYNINRKLNDQEFKDVLVVIKHLIFENSIETKNSTKLALYFPNSRRQMKKLNSLYYMDKPSYELILKNSKQIKSITLFDIKELINQINSGYKFYSSDKIDQNCSQKSSNYKNLVFSHVSWASIFENFDYFKSNREQAPKRLSDKLIEKLKVDDLEQIPDLNLIEKLHSDQFINSLIECFQIVNDDNIFELDDELKKDITNCIKLVKVYRMDYLVTQFFDFDNEDDVFEDSKKNVKIARLKKDNDTGINFMIRSDFCDDSDIYFYLAETIVEEIKKLFVLNSYKNMRSIPSCLDKRSYRFIYMITKLLHKESHDEFIINYKLEFPMPIV